MVNLTIKDYAIGTLTFALLISLGFNVPETDTHFCLDKLISMDCDRLSSTGKTCYPTPATTIGKKYCSSGWEEISKGLPVTPVTRPHGADKELCPVGGPCVPIE